MARTSGWKPLPLPEAFTTRLHTLGFIQTNAAEPPVFRHPKRRDLFVQAYTSNIPGDTDMVIAMWAGEKVRRIRVDELLDLLTRQLEADSASIHSRPEGNDHE